MSSGRHGVGSCLKRVVRAAGAQKRIAAVGASSDGSSSRITRSYSFLTHGRRAGAAAAAAAAAVKDVFTAEMRLPLGVRAISLAALQPSDTFQRRHNSPTVEEQQKTAEYIGFESIDKLIEATVPKSIVRDQMKLNKFDDGLTESDAGAAQEAG